MKIKKTLAMALSLVVALSTVFGSGYTAMAKSSRAAEVVEVVGEVTVTKAGGSKGYRAFAGMTLNQGDLIETGEGASLIIKTQDQEDEITIDANTSLYLSQLTDEGEGSKSKTKLWTGSLWNKVKTLTGANDTYEVETPTAVMGVRGTHFFVRVDPDTGLVTMMVGSGTVQSNNADNSSSYAVMPYQQLSLYLGEGSITDLANGTAAVDIDSIVQHAGPEIIEAIVRSAQTIEQENAAYIESLRQQMGQGAGGVSSDEIERLSSNLDNLIGNIINRAIEAQIINREQIQNLVDNVNKDLEKKIILDRVQQPKLTEREKQQQEQQKRMAEQLRQQAEAKKRQQEEAKQQQEALLAKLKEQQEKQKEAQKQAAEEAKRKAEEALKAKLAAEERAKFEERVKQMEDQAKKQNDAAAPAPTPSPAGGGGGNSGSDPTPAEKKATFTAAIDNSAELYSGYLKFDVTVSLEHVGEVHGAQLHLITDPDVMSFYNPYESSEWDYQDYFDANYDDLNGTIFSRETSEYAYDNVPVDVNGSPKQEAYYRVVNVPSASPAPNPVTTSRKLITIPFLVDLMGQPGRAPGDTVTVEIAKLVLTDANGNKINVSMNTSAVSIIVPELINSN